MGFKRITNLVDLASLTPAQKRELKSVLQDRQAKLQKAMDDVEAALQKLGQTPKKSKKRKSPKKKR
jgi:hypothetical protein